MEIITKSKDGFKYDPFHLPKAIDFRMALKKIDLPRKTTTAMQLELSKMTKRQIELTIEQLGDMRYTAINHHDYKMAAYCKAVKEFAEAYFNSIKAQRRI